jgi:hypothetical protein
MKTIFDQIKVLAETNQDYDEFIQNNLDMIKELSHQYKEKKVAEELIPFIEDTTKDPTLVFILLFLYLSENGDNKFSITNSTKDIEQHRSDNSGIIAEVGTDQISFLIQEITNLKESVGFLTNRNHIKFYTYSDDTYELPTKDKKKNINKNYSFNLKDNQIFIFNNGNLYFSFDNYITIIDTSIFKVNDNIIKTLELIDIGDKKLYKIGKFNEDYSGFTYKEKPELFIKIMNTYIERINNGN